MASSALALNSNEEFKTISEVAKLLDVPQHVLRFWEGQFTQIKPVKRKGGRRFYSHKDVELIEKIKVLLYIKGYTIKGAKKALNQNFIPIDDEMRKKDLRQIDIFESMQEPNDKAKTALRKILQSLKDAQNLLKNNDH